MPEDRVVLMTDYFLVSDSQGNMRRIYRIGCPRCGKDPAEGSEFCEGHRYMTGSTDAVLREQLEKAFADAVRPRWPGVRKLLSMISSRVGRQQR